MERNIRNAIWVFVTTAVAALAVFVTVQYGVGSLSPAMATAVSLTCPATGCTASSCHATQSTSGGTAAQGGTAGSNPGGTLTCPATGCTASSCHATSAGGRGRRGHGFPGQG